jgi:HlyD family secretion protein
MQLRNPEYTPAQRTRSYSSQNLMTKALVTVIAASTLGLAAYAVHKLSIGAHLSSTVAAEAGAAKVPWIAAAPGRVEPRSGEVRIGPALPGRVLEAAAKVNDKVEDGDMLLRLEDEEARARVLAAEAEAGARRRERDAQPATAGREEVRRAEDTLASAERASTIARNELDAAVAARRAGSGSDEAVAEARKKLVDARDKVAKDRAALATAQGKAGVPSPNRFESSVISARAEIQAADAALEKTRVRAPIAGTLLQVNAKLGETVAPGPDQPLIVMGDMSVVRVKAEVDERDVGKLRVGQKAFVRSDAYPGRDFEGTVAALAPALTPPRIGQRGPRRPTDVEVLEVTIDLEGAVPLLPGMRVDAYFRAAEQAN